MAVIQFLFPVDMIFPVVRLW